MKFHHLVFVLGMLGIGYYFGTRYFTNNSNTITNEPTPELAEPSQRNTTVTTAPVTQRFDSEQATIELFEKAAPSVCYITTKVIQRDYWSRNVEEIPQGSGSGFVWDKEGHIVTNAHVISNSNKAYVTLSDGSTWEAKTVGK
ncbi:MAG TPA: 2-alkenal reductase, partial [Saprospiraceae bacterium]|nr:2-alkenal reductase [Saprospiraceae bacterium]